MFLLIVVFEATMALVLFGAAGRWDLPWFWAVIAIHSFFMMSAVLFMDPELRRERVRPGPGGRDRKFRVLALPLILAHLVVAGLDVGRFGWSGPIPVAVHAAALVGYAGGMGLAVWAMTTNRYFSPVVRIQSERGHRLVTSGPYRVLRHPGYAGGIVASLCGGVALGSWWSLLPLTPLVLLFLRRLALEERMLRSELEGYVAYSDRVRYRLVPGLW
jgi:protein-S-isoprenylcysteine O-methyltransferase Ste14